MELVKKEDYKVSQKIDVSNYKSIFGTDTVYLVPMSKRYNSIKSNGNFNDYKQTAIAFAELGNVSYNGLVNLYPDGTFSQYRDGNFYHYIGKIAI
jgi:hypothetical protein